MSWKWGNPGCPCCEEGGYCNLCPGVTEISLRVPGPWDCGLPSGDFTLVPTADIPNAVSENCTWATTPTINTPVGWARYVLYADNVPADEWELWLQTFGSQPQPGQFLQSPRSASCGGEVFSQARWDSVARPDCTSLATFPGGITYLPGCPDLFCTVPGPPQINV